MSDLCFKTTSSGSIIICQETDQSLKEKGPKAIVKDMRALTSNTVGRDKLRCHIHQVSKQYSELELLGGIRALCLHSEDRNQKALNLEVKKQQLQG